MADLFDRVILVDAPRRCDSSACSGPRPPETEAMAMIAAQMPAELKRARADFVIENNGTVTELERRVQAVWVSLRREPTWRVGRALVTPVPGRRLRSAVIDAPSTAEDSGSLRHTADGAVRVRYPEGPAVHRRP